MAESKTKKVKSSLPNNEEKKEKKKALEKSTVNDGAKKVERENKTSKKITKKKESWLKGVMSEFKKVRWPNKKEMVKYSIATILFILFFALFFYIIEVLMYFVNLVM